jgi:hypothetical protein
METIARLFKSVIVGVVFVLVLLFFIFVGVFVITNATDEGFSIPYFFTAVSSKGTSSLFNFQFQVDNVYLLPAVAVVVGAIYFFFGSKKPDAHLEEDIGR